MANQMIVNPAQEAEDLRWVARRIACEAIVLTPSVAKEFLEKNTRNRAVSTHNFARMRAALIDGRWRFNGSTVVFDTNGDMIDGQHRCLLVVETGIPIITVVVRGVDPDAFDAIDTGKKRSSSDVLSAIGKENYTRLAGALAIVAAYRKGTLQHPKGLDTTEVRRALAECPGIERAVSSHNIRGLLVPPSVMAGLYYLFSKVDAVAADAFVSDLKSGAGLHEGDAVLQLRERLIKNKDAKAKLPRGELAALVIKAWNHRYRGNAIKNLRWRSGDRAEKFPAIDGLSVR